MRDTRLVLASLCAIVILTWSAFDLTPASAGTKEKTSTHKCEYAAHGSPTERSAKPPGTPGGGGGNGGGGGKGDKIECGKTFGAWDQDEINVFVDDSGEPIAVAGALGDLATLCFAEWGCHSGIGDDELIKIKWVDSAAEADIEIGWGDLGSSGILGQASTSLSGGTITHSTITMNSNQTAFKWIETTPKLVTGTLCAIEDDNGDTTTSNYDLLSVLLHEVGHAIGIDHPNRRCSTRDKCYAESMYSCTDAEEYMRRNLNPGDEAAVQSLYGEDG